MSIAIASAASPEDFPVRMLGLRNIEVDPDVQSRACSINVTHAAGITKFIIANGPISEPVIVFFDGKKYWLADGFHRVEGYRKAIPANARFKQIKAEIRPGTREDAIVFSAGANKEKTYLKRTPEDIKRAFFMLMDLPEWQGKSAQSLSYAVGVSRSQGKRLWVSYFSARVLPVPNAIKTSDGKIRTTAQRRARSGEPPRVSPATNGGFQARIDGKRVYLGPSYVEAESRALAIVEESDSARNVYDHLGHLADRMTSLHVHSESVIGKGRSKSFPGIFGRKVGDAAFTSESFRDNADAVAAAGRALWLREYTGLARAVVLCPVEDGPAEVMDVFRKLGVEWMTIEDFAASLGAATPPPDAEAGADD